AKGDMRNRVAVSPQHAHKFGQQGKRVSERVKLCDLAPDVHVYADDLDALEFSRVGVDLARAADRYTKLVLGFAGCDLVMGLRVDIGIDANRHIGGAPLRYRNRREQLELRLGFDV